MNRSIYVMFEDYIKLGFKNIELSKIQYIELKRAFMAGLSSSLIFFKEISLMTEIEANVLFAGYEEQLKQFWDNELKETEQK